MIAQTVVCLSARWPAALVAVSRSVTDSDAWFRGWGVFFDELRLQEKPRKGGCDNTSNIMFDTVPTPLLRSIAQHWVDKALLSVTSARLAEVYTPVHANASNKMCDTSHQPLSSSVSPLASSAELELLLATWSAHMFLSVLHAPHQTSVDPSSNSLGGRKCPVPATVSEALAACLERDIIPVLSYLTAFGRSPAVTAVSHQHHHLTSPMRALRHALVLLLTSFVATWCEGPQNETAPCRSAIRLTKQEHSLALELCRSIAALGGLERTAEGVVREKCRGDASGEAPTCDTGADTEGLRTTSLDALTGAQLTLAQAALSEMLNPDDCSGGSAASNPFHLVDSEANDGPLWRACEAWMGGAAPPSSPFAGITKAHKKEELSGDILERMNSQLNAIARRAL
ncbi:hypothetical protein JKF63_04160 [Porcisia hertigi]|uniref:Uncharacterized protein n=1 Tax=Porcisia hertigi TaxID=2761500 RepID=A0A836LB53_9TRYP|nr:hypothetical protein JKF63_04160 [Porcisia hertigi]